MSSKLYPDRSKIDICTLTDASLSLETAQELSRVLDEHTRALQQQLNCSVETSGVVNQLYCALRNAKCARRARMITCTSAFHDFFFSRARKITDRLSPHMGKIRRVRILRQ